MLMISKDSLSSDVFWFRLYTEIGNILYGEYGISFLNEYTGQDSRALRYAEDTLIAPAPYHEFVTRRQFDADSISAFARRINRAPAIVLGRLQRDRLVNAGDKALQPLRSTVPV